MLIKCSCCNKELSIHAKSCLACGSLKPFKGVVLKPSEHKELKYKEIRQFQKAGGKIKNPLIVNLTGIAVLVGIAYVIFAPPAPLTPAEKDKQVQIDNINSARHSCQHLIRKIVKIPKSLEFDYDSEMVRKRNGLNQWDVTLSFESRNAFGVMIPNQASCVVTKKGGEFYARFK